MGVWMGVYACVAVGCAARVTVCSEQVIADGR
jgi:hypothetical protein